MPELNFDEITPDEFGQWLSQSAKRFRFKQMLPLTQRQVGIKANPAPEPVFALSANGVNTARDEWVYDFDRQNLLDKARFFADTYNRLLESGDNSLAPEIKGSRNLHNEFHRGKGIAYGESCVIESLYRPFVVKRHFADFTMNDGLTGKHYEIFGPDLRQPNKVINICANGKDFYALAADKLTDRRFAGDTHCLPLYRYMESGERVCNITDWAVGEVKAQRLRDWGEEGCREIFGAAGITAEDIFAYLYGVLHDREYRYDYRVDLLREFPRLPLYHDFDLWLRAGRELLDLHLGFEMAEPYPLERRDNEKAPAGGGKAILKADKEKGLIRLDEQTTLAGIPESAWQYRLGSRSALEGVLEQYKERKPKDATIAAKFNAYRFADYKESVIALLQRVCTVSVRTAEIMDGIAFWLDGRLAVFGDRDQNEWSLLGLAQWFDDPDDPDDDPEYQAWLAALPDIGAGEQ